VIDIRSWLDTISTFQPIKPNIDCEPHFAAASAWDSSHVPPFAEILRIDYRTSKHPHN